LAKEQKGAWIFLERKGTDKMDEKACSI